MPAFSIIGELLMKTASFETDTGRAAKSLQRLQKEAKATQAAFKASFAGNLLSDLAQQFGRALVNVPAQALAAVDALNDVSDATGSTVENVSALERVARLNGQTLDDVSSILVKFNAALKEADGKNGISQALAAIGLNAKELKNLDPAEALRRTSVALAGFADDGNKARLVQELFGKSVKEAGQFLKDLAEQTELVGTRTLQQTKEVEKFNKELFLLKTNSEDAGRSLTIYLAGAINQTIEKFREGAKAGKGFFQTLREEQLKLLGIDVNAEESEKSRQERIQTLTGLLQNQNLTVERRIRLENQLAGLQAKSFSNFPDTAGGGRGRVNPDLVRPGVSLPDPKGKAKKAEKPTEYDAHVKAFIEENQRLADALGDAQHAYESFYQQQQQTLQGFEDDAASARELADIFGFTQEELAKLNVEKLRAAATSLELLAITKGDKENNADLARLYREQAKALRARAGAEEELIQKQRLLDTDPLTGASKAVKDYLDNISKAGLATYDVVTGALHSLEDITVEALQGGNIKSAAKSLVNQIIAEFYRLQIVRPLLNSIFSSGGGLEGILRLFNGGTFAGGNTTQSGSIDFSGTGFPLASGTNYVPYDGFKASLHEGEAVVPKAYNPAGNGGGDVSVQVINNTGAPVREERSESGGRKLVKIMVGEIARDMSRGGQTRQAARSAVGPGPRRG